MKQTTLEKAIQKAGYSVLPPDRELHRYDHSAKCGKAWLTFHVQNGDAICVRVAPEWDRDEPQSDYFAGSFYQTIKSAMRAVSYYNTGHWDI